MQPLSDVNQKDSSENLRAVFFLFTIKLCKAPFLTATNLFITRCLLRRNPVLEYQKVKRLEKTSREYKGRDMRLRKHSELRKEISAGAFMLPCLAGAVIFYVYPLFAGIRLVFFKNSVSGGIEEFLKLFSSDSFRLAMKNMLIFVGVTVPLLLAFSMTVALSMRYLSKTGHKRVELFFLLHLLPMIVPSAVVAVICRFLLAQYGTVNNLLALMGFGRIDFLYSDAGCFVLGLIFLWKNYGYCSVVLFGGLMSVPEDNIEAAMIDGAAGGRIFFSVLLPQIRGFVKYAACMGIIGVFKCFRESYLLFGKYPYDSVYMYQNFMNNHLYSMNYGRLIASSLVLILFFGAAVYFLLVKNMEED